MADFFLKPTASVERANATSYVLGQRLSLARADAQANFAVMRRYVYEVTTAGPTGAAAPVYPTVVGGTVTDGSAVLTCRECDSWTNAARHIDYIASRLAPSDTLYESPVTAEPLSGASTSITFGGTSASPNRIVCVTEADVTVAATTGTLSWAANQNWSFLGSFQMYGVTMGIGTGGTASTLTLAAGTGTGNRQRYEKCVFNLSSTSASASIVLGAQNSSSPAHLEWGNCDVKFAASVQGIRCNRGTFRWVGGSVLPGTALTGTLFTFSNAASEGFHNDVYVEGVDFSSLGASASFFNTGGTRLAWNAKLINCRLPTAWTGSLVSGTGSSNHRVEMHNCDNADTNYRLWVEDYAGSIVTDTVVTRTGGATDGLVAFSHKMTCHADASYAGARLRGVDLPPLWSTVIGTPQTVRVEILADQVAALTNEDVWLEVRVLATSGTPLGTLVTSGKATPVVLATSLPTSVASWVTTGVTNPVAYRLSATFTAQEVGFIQARVVGAKSGLTFYVDVKLTVA